MPRRDRTFTDADMIRIYLNHLDPEERRFVEDFFAGLDFDVLDEVGGFLLEILGLVPVIGTILDILGIPISIDQFVRSLQLASDTIERINRLRQ